MIVSIFLIALGTISQMVPTQGGFLNFVLNPALAPVVTHNAMKKIEAPLPFFGRQKRHIIPNAVAEEHPVGFLDLKKLRSTKMGKQFAPGTGAGGGGGSKSDEKFGFSGTRLPVDRKEPEHLDNIDTESYLILKYRLSATTHKPNLSESIESGVVGPDRLFFHEGDDEKEEIVAAAESNGNGAQGHESPKFPNYLQERLFGRFRAPVDSSEIDGRVDLSLIQPYGDIDVGSLLPHHIQKRSPKPEDKNANKPNPKFQDYWVPFYVNSITLKQRGPAFH